MGATTTGFSQLFYRPNVRKHVFLITVLCTVTFFAYALFSIETDTRARPASLSFISEKVVTRIFSTSNNMANEQPIQRHNDQTKAPHENHESHVDFTQKSYTSPSASDVSHATQQHGLTEPPSASSNKSIFRPIGLSHRDGLEGDTGDAECRFPEQDPFHPSILKKFKLPKTLTCTPRVLSLIYRDGDYFKFNSTLATENKLNITNCKLFTLQRKTEFILGEDLSVGTFTTFIEIPEEGGHFMTTCHDRNLSLSRSYFSVIREKKNIEERCETNYKNHLKENSPKETLSVLFVGVDGISRQSMIRSMNKTKHFVLENLKAMEFFKFNKVGDNTFPNVVPLLTGLSKDELLNVWPSKKNMDPVDHLFLWTDFRKAGYRTAMVLDRKRITAFHYLKGGWKNPVFDYYNRVMILKTEEDVESRTEGECCIGKTPEVSFLLDNWLQLTSTFNNTESKPYFGFSFLNRLTHELANRVSMADDLFLQFFRSLHSSQVLNNTLLVFFSDHGPRFGPTRHTFSGILESRTPFLFLIFPKWFESKYPHLTTALRINQHRLVTMFDLHATLKDLLKFQGRSSKGSLHSRGISLFNEIPKERTCNHAGIPTAFCMCKKMNNIQISDGLSTELATSMVQHIVNLTEKLRDKCQLLNLSSVQAVASVEEGNKNAISVYQVIIETIPNKAVYEGVLKYDDRYDKWDVLGVPVRLNFYKGQAECIDSAKLRPFCYCTNVDNPK